MSLKSVHKKENINAFSDDDDTRLMAIFQDNLVSRYQKVSILDFIGNKDDRDGDDNWSYESAKLQSIVITNKPTPNFYKPDALPVALSTVSKQ